MVTSDWENNSVNDILGHSTYYSSKYLNNITPLPLIFKRLFE